jgi:Fe-S cluster biogenesis protein NfuA
MSTDADEVRALPGRIEGLLDAIGAAGGPVVAEQAEDLVAAVLTLYGAGLARIVGTLDESAVRRLAGDALVANLLLLHDLHPDSTEERVQAALDHVRPYLGSHAGGIEYLGVDDEGVAHLRLQGSCDSCPSSTQTVQNAVEQAVLDAAPEVVRLEVEGMAPPPPPGGLLQIGRRPEFDSCPVPEATSA